MKKTILASACILALASSSAFAQTTKPSDSASSQGNVGPGASQGAMKDGTGTMKQGTTGTSSRPSPGGDASTSGAPRVPPSITPVLPRNRVLLKTASTNNNRHAK